MLKKIFKIFLLNKSIKKTSHKFCIPIEEIFYNKKKNHYYFKLSTASGFICRDVSIEEIFNDNSILSNLDKNSFAYVHYVAGKLENLSNEEKNSIFIFHAIDPYDKTIFIVKSLIDLSIHKWNIFEAFNEEKYYNLDKASIVRFMERYFIAKTNNTINNLRIVK